MFKTQLFINYISTLRKIDYFYSSSITNNKTNEEMTQLLSTIDQEMQSFVKQYYTDLQVHQYTTMVQFTPPVRLQPTPQTILSLYKLFFFHRR